MQTSLYVLVSNPGKNAAHIKVTYLLPSGDPFTKTYIDLLTETYLLIANTSTTDGSATVTLHRDQGDPRDPVVIPVTLKASSRVSVPLSPYFSGITYNGTSYTFGAIVGSNGVEIVVERAMYKTVNGIPWSWGTAALATKLQ